MAVVPELIREEENGAISFGNYELKEKTKQDGFKYNGDYLFGIGVGIYPIGIEKLFSQVIYAQNPYKLIEGISLFFGDVSKYKEIQMKSFIMAPNIEKITSNCSSSYSTFNASIVSKIILFLSLLFLNFIKWITFLAKSML